MSRIGLLGVCLWLGCSRSEPPPRFAPPTPTPADIAPLDETSAEDAAPLPNESDAEADVAPAAPLPETVVSPLAAEPKVDAEVCRAACDNALTVTLAELPESPAPSMREELTRVLREDCPARCLAKASIESARCIAGAKSALQLAACP